MREVMAMYFFPACTFIAVIGAAAIAVSCMRDLMAMMRRPR